MTALQYAGLTDRGQQRPRNEDRWFADARQQLFLVADGMGGHQAGDVASDIVVKLLPQRLAKPLAELDLLTDPRTRQQVERTVATLSNEMRKHSAGQPVLAGMGATVVLAIIRERQALVVHLGDSRAYQFRSGRLRQLTRDHTLKQLLIDAGAAPPDDPSDDYPGAHQLTRYVGMEGALSPESLAVPLAPGDRLLLCSDGLHGMLDDANIESTLKQQSDPLHCCRQLVDAANQAGGRDNITVLIVAIG